MMTMDPAGGVDGAERLAREHLATGDYASACRALNTALDAAPQRYDLRCLLALAHQSFGFFAEARQCYEAALAVAPPSPELLHNLGLVCMKLDDLPHARKYFEQALVLRPEALNTLDELAGVLQATGDISGALQCYERVLGLDPQHQRAYVGMGSAFADAGWDEDAVRSFETALRLEPASLEALNGLGIVCKRLGRYEEALQLFDRALALSPAEPALLRNKAMLFGALGQHEAAEACYRELLAIDPADPDAHFSRGCACLMRGDLLEGWREYEYRWTSSERDAAVKPPPSALPRWSGEPVDAPASGLIIYAEQGFGDGIQFARYVPLAAARFARVILHTRKPLLALFQRSFGGYAEVVAEVPDEAGFSHHCPLMSLPLAFSTTLDSIPAQIPYLLPDPVKLEGWRARLAAEPRLKVGLAWATGKRGLHKRSFELSPALLAPLLANTDVCWVSLNKEPLDDAQRAILATHDVQDWSGQLADFDDTAALVEALDLVISVDTASAHLAGALGKPVWLLNRAESEWRWMLERSDSPWYPTMRIFRQRVTRQWEPVIDEVAQALRALFS